MIYPTKGAESAVYDIEAHVGVDAYTTVMGLLEADNPLLKSHLKEVK